jgi:hypothetical protein
LTGSTPVTPGPVKTRWYIQRMYQAASTMAVTAIAPTHHWCWKAAMITRISETNCERPGRPSTARPEIRKTPASTGAVFSTPVMAEIEAVPLRCTR